ncbi:MAG: HPF/RaiA family ribosome-associated protein [Candidatus Calescibacterium sp.]|jgi:ribosomal subunit interface protein|nr:HPF/RaiA family ribosome-associated protein [Candidatus Calescibacterium sp.]
MEEQINGMKLEILSKDIDITDYIKQYFIEKFSKVISKIPDGMKENSKAYFIYKKEGKEKVGEIIITVSKRNFPVIYTSESGEDPRVIIDKLAYEVERQIEKLKTEFEKQMREEMKTKRDIPQEIEEFEEKMSEEISSEEELETKIERVQVRIEKPITLDDAIVFMKESEKKKGGKKFPIFIFNDFDGKIKILFKQSSDKLILFEVET